VGRAVRATLVTHAPFAAGYVLAMWVGRLTAPMGNNVSLVWPAAGVGALWILFAARRRHSVPFAAAALGGAALLGNALTGSGWVLAAVFATGNAVQALLTLFLFRWWQRMQARRTWWRLRSVGDVARLGGSVVAATVVAALMGPVAVTLQTGADYAALASVWVLRNVVGSLWIVPLVVRLFDDGLPQASRPWNAFKAHAVEVGALAGASVVVYTLVYGSQTAFVLSFVPISLSLWAAMRLDTTLVGLHSVFVAFAITLPTVLGSGPFDGFSSEDGALLAQLWIFATLVFTWLISTQRTELAALLAEVQREREQSAQQAELLGAVFGATADAITVFDAYGKPFMRNDASMLMFAGSDTDISPVHADSERSRARFLGRDRFYSLDPEHALVPAEMPLPRALAGEVVMDQEVGFVPAHSDAERVLTLSAFPMPAVAGQDGGAVVLARDVTGVYAQQDAIRRARDDYEMLLAAATEQAILACDASGVIRLANAGAENVLGLSEAQLRGTSILSLHDPYDLVVAAAEHRVSVEDLHVHLADSHRKASRRWVMATPGAKVVAMTVTKTPDGGFLCVASDVTAQVESEARLQDSEARFRHAFDTAPVSMFIVGLEGDDRGRVLECNSTSLAFLDRDRDGIVGEELDAFAYGDDAAGVHRWVAACAEGHKDHVRAEVRFSQPSSAPAWGLISASVVDSGLGAAGAAGRYLMVLVEDVTARKAAEDALVRQALHDDLTGLPNRVLLNDRLEFALRAIVLEPELSVGVLFCDLDGFKDINDAYGHGVGDEVLREVARRFEEAIGPHDTVARLGGDEFAIVCPDIDDPARLRDIAQRLLDSLRETVKSTRGDHHVGVSIGITWGDRDADEEVLLSQADAAMYESKRQGKNCFHMYDEALHARSLRSSQLMPELIAAHENREFIVFGQPVVSLETGLVVAIETLMRWRSPTRGLVPPGEFLDVLETSSLMVPVGSYVLDESCRIAAAWPPAPDGSHPLVHVNVSGKQLAAGGFVDVVLGALRRHRLSADRLVIELTETHMPHLTLELLEDLVALREKGVKIALDDLGTGYSSLARLTELPIDVLKIDRAFVQGMGSDDRCDAVVRAVVGMADAMGVDVVAEGVERSDQAAELARLGCAYAQGFMYAKPYPEDLLANAVGTTFDVITGAPLRGHDVSTSV